MAAAVSVPPVDVFGDIDDLGLDDGTGGGRGRGNGGSGGNDKGLLSTGRSGSGLGLLLLGAAWAGGAFDLARR